MERSSHLLFQREYSKKDNPFHEELRTASYYFPSVPLRLTPTVRQTKLAAPPTQLTDGNKAMENKENELTPKDKVFLSKTNSVIAKELPSHDTPSPGNTSSQFNESWPTSERPSTIDSPSDIHQVSGHSLEQDTRGMTNISSQSSASTFSLNNLMKMSGQRSSSEASSRHFSQPKTDQRDSVLAQYIHRFRHAKPQSRSDRQSATKMDFWWLSSSPPTRDTSSFSSGHVPPSRERRVGTTHGKQRTPSPPVRKTPEGFKGKPSDSSSSLHLESTPILDEESAFLQVKAQRLLEKSETSLSDFPVSSDGVGSSPSLPSSSEVKDTGRNKGWRSSLPVREPLLQSPLPVRPDQKRRPKFVSPEDDILYQWRLRRKMEVAKQPELTKNSYLGQRKVISQVQQSSNLDRHVDVTVGLPTDSTLETFRQRLKNRELLSQARPGKDIFLEGPQVCTRGTDPIPQTASTQTNHTHRNDTCQTKHANIQDYREIFDGKEQRTGNNCGTKDDVRSEFIASPNIDYSISQMTVEPHLHLSCDIVPCRHGDTKHKHVELDSFQERAYSYDRREGRHENLRDCRTDEIFKDRDASVKSYVMEDIASQPEKVGSKERPPPTVKFKSKQNTESATISEKVETDFERKRRYENREKQETKTRQRQNDGGIEHPKKSSPISATIGQVVSSRLFSPETSVVSRDPSSDRDHHSSDLPQNQSQERSTEDLPSSDSDEFAEDELLKILRQRRDEYIQQLQHLDSLLENVNGR